MPPEIDSHKLSAKISFVRILRHLTPFFYTCDSWWWSQKFWSIRRLLHEYIHKPGTRIRDKDVNWWLGKRFPPLKIVLLVATQRCATPRCSSKSHFDFWTSSVTVVKEMCMCVHVYILQNCVSVLCRKKNLWYQHWDDEPFHLE